MHTLLTDDVAAAASWIRRGHVVAFPTETVYGLGADAFRPEAVAAIFAAKGRPADNPLIVHIADRRQAAALATAWRPAASTLMDHFFPGPLTLVLPRHPSVPAVVTGGLPTIGVRMPDHPVARAFLDACGTPVAAPSANRSGRPSPTTWQAVQADLDGRIPCILRGDRSPVGLESTVVDCTADVPVVLRAGAVTLEALRRVCPGIHLAGTGDALLARSPGTRYRHYAPHARVRLVDHPRDAHATATAGYIGLEAPGREADFGMQAVCATPEQYSYALFDFFRRCDGAGLETIYCQRLAPTGLGLALMDRLRRAAQEQAGS